ncbi:ACP S-malonyltransferase [Mycolicibacterium sp. CH28]|uniref:ACP S-malonyltransferase n=1 Tax=Mycolicibacterium sp. CH28 TaxID=2512237 RepID=UPI001F1C35FC|nr:acyltransferase domain-containing protein [Mycolicibacterium sp. CH28]
MSLALLFPGQGSEQPGVLDALPKEPAVFAVLDESRAWLQQHGLRPDIDDTDTLHDTSNAQLVLLIAGVACARTLIDDYGAEPRFVAGHSVGAFASAVTAGVLTLTEALAAVRLRARLMKQACAQGDWGMAVITGLPTREASQLVHSLGTDLWIANVNSAT